ncbi:hypothetical protein [Microcoleus sp.]|uniref:hypothetical protein n=1 Tax=Microcoleus sp. TaxID=44472 RepID=UPI003525DE74
MQILKVCALTTSGLVLWLAPPFTLSRKIPLHNWVTGLSLMGGFACCFESRRIALKLAQTEEFESMREAVVVADAVDELATSAYISEQQRRIEAEGILNKPEKEEAVEALKRAWLLDCGEPAEPAVQAVNQPDSNTLAVDGERFTSLNLTKKQAIELIQKIRSELNQTQTIEKLWECKKGGSEAWKRAYAQFKSLMEDEGRNNG